MDKQLRALIVEQEPLPRDLMDLALQNMGCRVFATSDGAEARRMLRQHQPDLLVIDTFLPGVSGFDLLKSFQTAHLLERTRVIVVSALGFEETVRKAAQLGVDSYLVKPIDVRLFTSRIKALLSVSTAYSAKNA